MSITTHIGPRLQLGRYFADVLAYGELMLFLAGRDLAVRYKQTFAGVLWAILVPLITVFALSFVFGSVAKLEGSSLLAVYAGMIPWQFFSTGLQTGGTSLLNNNSLVTKLYFPRLILPISSMGVALVDFFINLIIILIMGAFLGAELSWKLALIPLWVLLAFFVTLGPVLMIASALVHYRDLRFLIPFIIQFGLFITPVGYIASVVPEYLRGLYNLNPLVGVIEGMRWSILNTNNFPAEALGFSIIIGTLLLFIGGAFFIKTEETMADEI